MPEHFNNIMQHRDLWPDSAEFHPNDITLQTHSLTELSNQHGTPLYLFDGDTITNLVAQYHAGFATYPAGATIYYACKALLNTAIIQLLHQNGCHFDVVSLNELEIVRHAGVPAANAHLHGNGTPPDELTGAVELGIGRIVIDNFAQLNHLKTLNQPQIVLLRIAPDVTAGGHEKIQTGKATSKFGFNIADGTALTAIQQAHAAPNLTLSGLHSHAGSQIRSYEALRQTVSRLFELAATAYKTCGWHMRELSPGGGLAVPTNTDETIPIIADYCRAITDQLHYSAQKHNLPLPHLSIEPGRSLVARAGVALYTITGTKQVTNQPTFIHIDGGIGDNLRPAMYGAKYEARVIEKPLATATQSTTIAGRYCESGDILIHEINIPATTTGERLALPATGAYTLSMASNYNGIGRPAVLLLQNKTVHIIQRRETWRDLIARDLPISA